MYTVYEVYREGKELPEEQDKHPKNRDHHHQGRSQKKDGGFELLAFGYFAHGFSCLFSGV